MWRVSTTTSQGERPYTSFRRPNRYHLIAKSFMQGVRYRSLAYSLLYSGATTDLNEVLLRTVICATPGAFTPVQDTATCNVPGGPSTVSGTPGMLGTIYRTCPTRCPAPVPPVVPVCKCVSSKDAGCEVAGGERPAVLGTTLFPTHSLRSSKGKERASVLTVPTRVTLKDPDGSVGGVTLRAAGREQVCRLFLTRLVLGSQGGSGGSLLCNLFF